MTFHFDWSRYSDSSTQGFRWSVCLPMLLRVGVFLIGAELLLHLISVRDFLPMPNPYYAEAREHHGRLLEKVVAEQGGVDFFFTGNSVTGSDIDAKYLERELKRITGRTVTCFSGWEFALSPHQAFFYYRHFWQPRVSPRVVVHGVSCTDLLHPGRASEFGLFQRGRFERLWLKDDAVSRVKVWLMQNVRLCYYKSFLPEHLRDFQLPINHPRGPALDERGMGLFFSEAWDERPAVADFQTPEEARRKYGYAVVHDTLPTKERCEVSLSALREEAQYFRQLGIKYVLLNLPHHRARYQSKEGATYYQAYLRLVQNLADTENVPFIDVTDGDFTRYGDEFFNVDHYHMNAKGAREFSRTLSRKLAEMDL